MKVKSCPICQIQYIRGKWKIKLISNLKDGTLRMGELEHRIPEANPRVLARQLRSLENDGIVQRKIYAEVPLRVEYSLTEYGKAMMELLILIKQFSKEHLEILKK